MKKHVIDISQIKGKFNSDILHQELKDAVGEGKEISLSGELNNDSTLKQLTVLAEEGISSELINRIISNHNPTKDSQEEIEERNLEEFNNKISELPIIKKLLKDIEKLKNDRETKNIN